jgi:hypothetical protein
MRTSNVPEGFLWAEGQRQLTVLFQVWIKQFSTVILASGFKENTNNQECTTKLNLREIVARCRAHFYLRTHRKHSEPWSLFTQFMNQKKSMKFTNKRGHTCQLHLWFFSALARGTSAPHFPLLEEAGVLGSVSSTWLSLPRGQKPLGSIHETSKTKQNKQTNKTHYSHILGTISVQRWQRMNSTEVS